MVTDRSAGGVSVSVSTAAMGVSPGTGTVAVLPRSPVAGGGDGVAVAREVHGGRQGADARGGAGDDGAAGDRGRPVGGGDAANRQRVGDGGPGDGAGAGVADHDRVGGA